MPLEDRNTNIEEFYLQLSVTKISWRQMLIALWFAYRRI